MNRRRKLGATFLVALAITAFSAPFLFSQKSQPPTTNPPPPPDDENEANGDTNPPAPPSSDNNEPPTVSWNGWHGYCHGQGHHYGIIKKALELNYTLPVC